MSKKIRRAVKDSVFTTLFGETKYTLDLYRSGHLPEKMIMSASISDSAKLRMR